MIALVSFIYHGVFDRYPKLRVAFLEGGCGWLPSLLDRAERDEGFFDSKDQPQMHFVDYFKDGRILIGCEGSEKSLAYVAKRVGSVSFAYASDSPHEVALSAAKHANEETAERGYLLMVRRPAVTAERARRFSKR